MPKWNLRSPFRQPGQRPTTRLIIMRAGVAATLILIAGLTIVSGNYTVNRRPLTELPGIERVVRAVSPRHLYSFAGVASPIGIAVSPDGNRVYVAEGSGERYVKVFDRNGKPLGQLAPPETTPGLRKPGHLAVDSGGRLYVADRLRASIDVYGSDLVWQSEWRPPLVRDIGGWLVNGLSIAPNGRFYLAEIGQAEHTILALDPDGSLLDRLGKSSGVPGGLKYPVQAVADASGRTYISDGANGRVIAVSRQGVVAFGMSGEELLSLPMGLTLGGGKLLVADAAAHRIVAFSEGDQPQFLHAFGDDDSAEGMSFPTAVTMDRTGRIFVADRANDRVQAWTY